MILAEATLPVEGSDAEIKFFFNTDLTQKPKVNEDGSVDFHHLDVISSVSAGDLLAELTPAVTGKPGIDVCGNLLRPVKVKQKILRDSFTNLKITINPSYVNISNIVLFFKNLYFSKQKQFFL